MGTDIPMQPGGRLRSKRRGPPLRIALIYVLVAGLWIVLSDRLLYGLFPDAEQLTWLQTVKGWFFVAATAAMLAWLVRRDQAALQAEINACQATQERFRALVATIPHGLQESDLEGTITFTNPGYDRILGLEPWAAIGSRIWDRQLDEADRSKLQDYLAYLVAEQPPPQPFVTRNLTGDGRLVDVQVDWDYLRDAQGRLTGFASIITDITERLAAEEAIRTSDRLKSELIGTAAHEFRTPLTTILGFSELLLEGPDFSQGEREEYLRIIQGKSIALADMVENLLDLSRIEAGQPLPMYFAPFTVDELAAEIFPTLKSLGRFHQIEVAFIAGDTRVQVDRERIGQVLENLLGNAVKYSAAGSLVSLCGEPAGARYRLTVTDQGIGMSEEEMKKIFEPFYRANTSDTSPSGLGIGMAMVKRIVEAHGGEVHVESAPGEGTSVSFDVPLAAES